MSGDHPPGTVVATLRLPIPAGSLDRLARALEAAYGPGLVMGQPLHGHALGAGQPGNWLVISTPAEARLAADKRADEPAGR